MHDDLHQMAWRLSRLVRCEGLVSFRIDKTGDECAGRAFHGGAVLGPSKF